MKRFISLCVEETIHCKVIMLQKKDLINFLLAKSIDFTFIRTKRCDNRQMTRMKGNTNFPTNKAAFCYEMKRFFRKKSSKAGFSHFKFVLWSRFLLSYRIISV